MKIAIKTLGCRSNRYESDKLFEELVSKGHAVFEINEGANEFFARSGRSDVFIVNTCTVTHIADKKSRQAVRSLKLANPEAKIIVFGCGVNVSKNYYSGMDKIDFLACNREEVLRIVEQINCSGFKFSSLPSCACGAQNSSDIPYQNFGKRTRALIKIQDGCNNFCSYCIIPHARGREVSFSSREIVKEAIRKENEGFREIVLTGINIGEWKEDGMELADLFEMLIGATSSVRFRVSSIEPKNFSDKFYNILESGRFCPHIHMSLQSGSDGVLRRMRRNYDCIEFERICEKFRGAVSDVALTTDVIVGFPGESDTEFAETCKFVERIGFSKVHVFPYSKRAKTAAIAMPNHVPCEIKRKRAFKLREISDKLTREFYYSQTDKICDVLFEESNDGYCKGYTMNYIPVRVPLDDSRKVRVPLDDSRKVRVPLDDSRKVRVPLDDSRNLTNEIVPVKLLSVETDAGGRVFVMGEILEK